MTLGDVIKVATRQLEADRLAMLAKLDAIDAAIDDIEARCGPHELIADMRMDTTELRARLLACAPETVH